MTDSALTQRPLGRQHRRDHLLARLLTGRSPGRMINYLAEGSANDPSVTSFIPGYKVVSGFDLDAYQIHARCILLDTKTGYRSQYLAISGVVNL